MIKYKTRFNKIEAIEVLRATEKQVVIVFGNTQRRENNTNWRDTWEDEHAFLVEEAEKTVNSLRLRLERAKGTLGQIKGMKPSDK